MPAVDALHLKRLLYEDLGSTRMRAMLDAFVQSSLGLAGDSVALPDLSRFLGTLPGLPSAPTGDQVAERMRRFVAAGETFYVAPHMLDLAIHASRTLPSEVLVLEDLPTMQGFMFLPAPLRLIDVRGKSLSINAIIWSAVGGAVELYLLTDRHDPSDAINARLHLMYTDAEMAEMPRLQLAHSGRLLFGKPLPTSLVNTTIVPPEADLRWALTKNEDGTVTAQMVTDAVLDLTNIDPETGTFTETPDPLTRTLVALWRLMQQPIVDLRVEEPDRYLRKQMRRAGLPDRNRVTIIELRRREGHGPHYGEEHGVDWSHQWVVRGHWRRQPCKVEGEPSIRVIWIHPYVKGPEGKPLIIRDRVNALLR